MASVYPTNPVANNLLPSNINSYIAKGPDYSWLANLPTDYFQGQQAGYQARNQNAFQGGLPHVDPNDPNSPIDWTAVQKQLAQVGGTAQIGNVMNLEGVKQDQNLPSLPGVQPQASSPPSSSNAIPSQNVAGPPNTAGGSQTTDQRIAPSQVASANPNGIPQAVQSPGPATQNTPRSLSQQTGVDAQQIAKTGGIGVDDPIPQGSDPQSLQARQRIIALLASARTGSQPSSQAQQPSAPPSSSGPQAQQVTQPQPQGQQSAQPLIPTPQGNLQQQLATYEAIGQRYSAAAQAIARFNPERSKRLQAIADYALDQAKQIEGASLKNQEPTPDILNARASGMASPLDYQGAAKEQETQIGALNKLADNGIDARGKLTQLNAVQQLGEKVGYGVIPSLQSFLGEYGINTDGLSDIQSYERAIDFMAPQLRPVGSGRLMQKELDSFKAALGGLMTTPEGRRISLENLKLINQYSAQVGDIAADTSLSPSQRYQKIYSLTPPRLNIPQNASAPQSQGQQFQEGQTATNPQTGQRAIFKSGQWQMLQ